MTAKNPTISKQQLAKLGMRYVCEAGGITEYKLVKNGLRVLLKEDHSCAVATFMVAYECGSRNEGAGTTGSAHFFEHLMFKGTRAFDPLEGNGPMEVFGRVGASLNAMTGYDVTRYYEVVPSKHIKLCIRLEANRMRGLKNRKSDRNSEMTVVRNEFERSENSASSVLFREVAAVAFREHPYHYPIIGARSDVEGVPLHTMVESFYNRFYWPNNATAMAIGDFQSLDVLTELSRRFGRISRSPKPIPTMYTTEPKQEGERRVEVKRVAPLGEVLVAYHMPEATHKDTYALKVLADILGNSSKPGTRLYQALVEKSLVSSTSASAMAMRDPGLFMVSGSLAPGVAAADVEAVLHAEVEQMAKEPVSDDELTRVKLANLIGTTLSDDNQSTQMMQLSSAVGLGNWKWHVEYDDHYEAVTKDDIMRVAAEYLHKDNRTVGTLVPVKGTAKPPKPEETQPLKTVKRKQRRIKIDNSVEPTNFAKQVKKTVLPNGLTVSVLKRGKGVVAINANIAAGSTLTAGLVSRAVPSLTAGMLSLGSSKFSKLELGSKLQSMGIGMAFSAKTYDMVLSKGGAEGVLMVKEHFDSFLEMFSDAVTAPLFDEAELARVLKQRVGNLTRSKTDTGTQAQNAFMRKTYPEGHPLRPFTTDESIAELGKVSVADLRDFHSRFVSPKSTVITVVGDIEPAEAVALIEKHLGSWTGPDRHVFTMPEPETRMGFVSKPEPIMIDIPGKASVDIIVGRSTSVARTSPDYFAARIAASVLGESTISDRLGKVLRVQNGLTYGVRTNFGDTTFGATPYWISVTVNPANVEKAHALVKEVVGKYVAEGITSQELADKIGQKTGSFLVQLRSCSGIASALAEVEFGGLGAQGLDEVVGRYQAVTKADVDKAIRTHLAPLQAVTVMAGSLAS